MMAYRYERFDIVEVAKRCGLRFYPLQRNGVEFKANCPFCADRKYHLGLNRQKELFHCFHCGEKGNSVSLYAKIFGLSNREAYTALKGSIDTFEPQTACMVEDSGTPLRPLEDRHNVYYDLLSLLKLQRCHRKALEERGLSFPQIHQFMYKSIPLDDVFRREVLEELDSKHDLIGIPGFYRDERGDIQMFLNRHGGIFIPVCNKDGYIQGLQMRLDLPEDSKEQKFRWFSSNHFKNGTGAKPWIHVVGDTTAAEACVTEGPIKADVTSVLSNGRLFIAVPGVSALNQLTDVLRGLRVRKVYEAFDMDKRSNAEVKRALIALRTTLRQNGIECVGCSWNPNYKGIDDYCLARNTNRLIAA